MIKYNFYCLENTNCQKKEKIVRQLSVEEKEKGQYCECGSILKCVGQSTSMLWHTGTQEHQNKVNKYNNEK